MQNKEIKDDLEKVFQLTSSTLNAIFEIVHKDLGGTEEDKIRYIKDIGKSVLVNIYIRITNPELGFTGYEMNMKSMISDIIEAANLILNKVKNDELEIRH